MDNNVSIFDTKFEKLQRFRVQSLLTCSYRPKLFSFLKSVTLWQKDIVHDKSGMCSYILQTLFFFVAGNVTYPDTFKLSTYLTNYTVLPENLIVIQ
jgi:hypothetical protein